MQAVRFVLDPDAAQPQHVGQPGQAFERTDAVAGDLAVEGPDLLCDLVGEEFFGMLAVVDGARPFVMYPFDGLCVFHISVP